jgi:hypothetical protein
MVLQLGLLRDYYDTWRWLKEYGAVLKTRMRDSSGFMQVVEGRFKTLLTHSHKLLRKRWVFGIADEFLTKQLPHNVTWGLSLLYAVEHGGDRAQVSVQGWLFLFVFHIQGIACP